MVKAVIFDWGGTLTPWHTIDHEALWLGLCEQHFPAGEAAGFATRLHRAEARLWLRSEQAHASATLADVAGTAGVMLPPAFWDSYYAQWDPHTYTDPEAAPLLRELRSRGIRIGVLSNTMWPRSAHQRVFERDNVADLIDGAVYTREIPWTKPHPEAFRAAMKAVGIDDPASCVFVGDRPFDDIYGAKRAGMRAVLVANSDVPAYDDARPDAVITQLSELPRFL